MEKSVFEQMDGTYHREGDYLLPDLALPESAALGVWAQREGITEELKAAEWPGWDCIGKY